MTKILGIISLMIFLASFSSIVAAQSTFQWPAVWDVSNIATLLDIPSDTLQSPSNFIFLLLVPFIAVWAICLGFLKQLRIFPRTPSIEIIISFCMAFATLPSGILNYFVSYLLAAAGGWATIMFFVMFFVGVTFYTWNWPGMTWRAGGIQRDLSKLVSDYKKIENEMKAAEAAGKPDTAAEKNRTLQIIQLDIDRKKAQLAAMAAHERERYERY
jgi:predicted membrane channel-forming protein YqfA (hemolysin III family)